MSDGSNILDRLSKMNATDSSSPAGPAGPLGDTKGGGQAAASEPIKFNINDYKPYSGTKLEDSYVDAYGKWKAERTPSANANLLKAIGGDIDNIVFSQVGRSGASPLVKSKARQIAIQSMDRYDPKTAKLKTFLHSQLKGLKRYEGKQSNILNVPERVSLDGSYLREKERSLEDELGRPPSDQEISNKTGLSLKRIKYVRTNRGSVTPSQMKGLTNQNFDPDIAGQQGPSDIWLEIVYDDLTPVDQKIMEWSIGWNGHRQRSNQDIAKALKVTPGAVSQRKSKIQKMINSQQDLGFV